MTTPGGICFWILFLPVERSPQRTQFRTKKTPKTTPGRSTAVYLFSESTGGETLQYY